LYMSTPSMGHGKVGSENTAICCVVISVSLTF